METAPQDGALAAVREHYRRHPYPPVPRLALPRRGQGQGLAFETGTDAAGTCATHHGRRILVAGGGTLEPLLVAMVHPHAQEVVAVDLSQRSLDWLATRLRLARLTRRLAPLTTCCADLEQWHGGTFDYVLATHVLQHHARPLALFQRIAAALRPGGILRLVTYPKASRFWMRAIGRWLRLHEVQAQRALRSAARRAIGRLDAMHPLRLAFEDNPEARSDAGVADAWLHPLENPCAPTEWRAAAAAAGLRLVHESQHAWSQSAFLDPIAPALRDLDPLVKLSILDDLLELGANPVLWFQRTDAAQTTAPPAASAVALPPLAPPGPGLVVHAGMPVAQIADRLWRDADLWLPSDLHAELGAGIRRVAAYLPRPEDVALLLAALWQQVGPRVAAGDDDRDLPGLTLPERAAGSLLQVPPPPTAAQWQEVELCRAADQPARLAFGEQQAPFRSLAQQIEWLQLSVGATHAWIGPLRAQPSR